tara:strand:- start:3271 stop:3399 length:129 start_codon:yes stop_codon:yes gene_type:complete
MFSISISVKMKDYASAASITVGCTIFILGGDTAPQKGIPQLV